ncbi:MAG: lipocalin family protein [Flavobacteriaceae bacterium]|jgi:hypothetical protein|nr:lipocalin family protein [Flavobacteriaceae bacterium]
MRKVLIISALVLFALSCNRDSDSNDNVNIVGMWNFQKSVILSGKDGTTVLRTNENSCVQKSTYEFKSDGSVIVNRYYLMGTCEQIPEYKDYYAYDKSQKTIMYNGVEHKVLELSSNKLTIQTSEPMWETDDNEDGVDDYGRQYFVR